MDLLAIGRTVWRHRLAVLPVLVLTLLGCMYVLVLAKPVYEAHTSYVLINPPANTDNPYTRFADQSVVVNILVTSVGSDTTRAALAAEGVDKKYQVAPSATSSNGPLIEVTGVGSTPNQAVRGALQVSGEVERTLFKMQQSHGVDGRYMIKAEQVERADTAQLKVSGRLRSLVALVAAGVLLTFVVVSVAEAISGMRYPSSHQSDGGRATFPAQPPYADPE